MMFNIEQIQETLLQHGYEYQRVLGSGSFSSVFLCKCVKYNQNFAIKRAIKHHITADEYDNLITLNHSYIIKLYNSFEDEDAKYLVFDYCSNGTIKETGKLDKKSFILYAKQILEAVFFCHSNNIAHRDIKPENIFLDQYNHIKLADFGMAKQFQIHGKSIEKCGSLMFCSPEMLSSPIFCPFKADIWALGITFFFMATGQYPFKNNTKDELIQSIKVGEINFSKYDVHPKIKLLITKMTIKDQNNRPTAEKLLSNSIFNSCDNDSLTKCKSHMKISFTKYYTHHNISLRRSLTFELNDENNLTIDCSQPIIKHTDIRSYKSKNPLNGCQRINSHYLIKK